jgi:hypothetical protein
MLKKVCRIKILVKKIKLMGLLLGLSLLLAACSQKSLNKSIEPIQYKDEKIRYHKIATIKKYIK